MGRTRIFELCLKAYMSLKQVTMRIVLLRNMLVSWWNSWQMGENVHNILPDHSF